MRSTYIQGNGSQTFLKPPRQGVSQTLPMLSSFFLWFLGKGNIRELYVKNMFIKKIRKKIKKQIL
jgi:hypothetical protein